jgi:hypothetical protein
VVDLFSDRRSISTEGRSRNPRGRPLANLLLGTGPLLAALQLGCTSDGERKETVKDSAGIAVADNTVASWSSETAWRIEPRPSLVIGAADGDPAYLLNGVRAATRSADGRILVGQGYEIRVFDADGQLTSTIGRRGQGPGEFAAPVAKLVALGGDTIAAYTARRVVYLDTNGSHLGAFTGPPEEAIRDHSAGGWELLPDGSVMVRLYHREPASRPPGVIRPRQGFVRFARGTARADTAGFFPGIEQVVVRAERRRVDLRPFGADVLFAAGGDRVYIADNAVYEVRGYTIGAAGGSGVSTSAMAGQSSPAFRLTNIVRRAAERAPVTEGDRRRWADDLRAVISRMTPAERADEGAMFERWIVDADFPAVKPAFDRLIADRSGNLWVSEIRPESGNGRRALAVYDRAGRLLGDVILPDDISILEIGDDYLLAVWRNTDDVEFLRLYSLIKP